MILLHLLHQDKDLLLDLSLFLVRHLDFKEVGLILSVLLDLCRTSLQLLNLGFLSLEIALAIPAGFHGGFGGGGGFLKMLLGFSKGAFGGLKEFGDPTTLFPDLHGPEIKGLELNERQKLRVQRHLCLTNGIGNTSPPLNGSTREYRVP